MKIKGDKKLILIYLFLLLPFFEPLSVRYFFPSIGVESICYYWRTIIGVGALVYYILVKKFKLSKAVFAVCLFAFMYMAISLFANAKLDYSFYFLSAIIGLTCLFECSALKDNYTIMKACYILLFFLLAVNLICLFIFPNGVINVFYRSVQSTIGNWTWDEYQRINFISNDNQFMQFIIPFWISLMVCYNNKFINRFTLIISLIIVNLNVFIIWSGTSIVGVLILDFLTIILLIKKKKMLNFSNICRIILGSNILIVVFNIQRFFTFFVEEFLNKDLSFTGRTEIWNSAVSMFLNSPIYGYGTATQGYLINVDGISTATHNLLLSIMLQGGIILLMAFLFYVYNCFYHNSISKSVMGQIMLSALLTYGIISVTETHITTYGFWCFLAMSNGIKYVGKENWRTKMHE